MPALNLNFHHLRLFLEVAHNGSLRGAAEKMRLSQPTISTQIKSLEDSLDERLFDRSGRGMRLTAAGRLLMEYAGQLFSLADEMVLALHGEGGARKLRLNLGIVQSLPKLVSWQLIRPVLVAFPNLRLNCIEGHAPELLGLLVSGRVDAILADEPAPTSLRVRAFSQHLNKSRFIFCAAPALAKQLRRDFPKSLDGAPALLPAERSVWRHELDQWFDARQIQPNIIAEFDDAALMKTAASDGLGFVPVLESVQTDAASRYGLHPIAPAVECSLSCYLVTVERTTRHPALAALVGGCRVK